MFKKLFCFICLVLFNTSVEAITFEQYIVDHESGEMRAYLTGYADAVHNNAFLLGGCPRRLTYRPYGEYFQHIDIYISKKTKDKSTNLDAFYQEPVEPLLTAVILKYINCNNPESRQLSNEPKRVQIEIRNLARNIIQQTQKYQTPEEREKEFAYRQHLDRLDNPKKYEKSCPKCPITQKTKPHKQVVKPTQPSVPAPLQSPKPPQQQPQPPKPVSKPPLQQLPVTEKQKKSKWYELRKKEPKDSSTQKDNPKTTPNMEDKQSVLDGNAKSPATSPSPSGNATIPQAITDPVIAIERPLADPNPRPSIVQPQIAVIRENKNQETQKDDTKKETTTESTKNELQQNSPKQEEEPKKPNNNYTLKSDDPFTMPEIDIPAQIVKKDVKEVDITDVQTKKYELESLDINLDNIQNVTLPSL